jgi:hypothetical protein
MKPSGKAALKAVVKEAKLEREKRSVPLIPEDVSADQFSKYAINLKNHEIKTLQRECREMLFMSIEFFEDYEERSQDDEIIEHFMSIRDPILQKSLLFCRSTKNWSINEGEVECDDTVFCLLDLILHVAMNKKKEVNFTLTEKETEDLLAINSLIHMNSLSYDIETTEKIFLYCGGKNALSCITSQMYKKVSMRGLSQNL